MSGRLREAFERQRAEHVRRLNPVGALVTAAIDAFPGDFTLTDLERACPGVSREMVRRVLMDLRRSDKVTCLGRGPGAAWRKKGPEALWARSGSMKPRAW